MDMGKFINVPNKYMGPLLLTLAASSWGSLYVVGKVVLTVIEPMMLVWIRMMIAPLILFFMGVAMHVSWTVHRKDIPLFIAIGLVGYFFSNWTQFYGTQISSAQAGSVLTATSPVFMVIFAYFMLHEMITWKKWVSVIMSTIGVVLIVGVSDISGGVVSGIILLVAAATWGLISVWVKEVPPEYNPIVITTYCMIISGLFLTPIELLNMDWAAVWQGITTPEVAAGLLYIVLIPTAAAYYFWNKGLTMIDASTGGMYFFFQPVVGTFLGCFFLGESIGFSFIAGTVLILAGIILVVREKPQYVESCRVRA